jgi:hypothetical protein
LRCRVTTELLWPFKEDVARFDFELDGAEMHGFSVLNSLTGHASKTRDNDAEKQPEIM